jgi:hypothetical protein
MGTEKTSESAPVDAVVIRWFRRDASFWSNPNVRSVKRVHVAHPENMSRFGHKRAICGNIALLEDYAVPNPPESMKCKRCLRCLDSRG